MRPEHPPPFAGRSLHHKERSASRCRRVPKRNQLGNGACPLNLEFGGGCPTEVNIVPLPVRDNGVDKNETFGRGNIDNRQSIIL